MSNAQEQKWIRERQMVCKRRRWDFAPDKLEHWLEKMEGEGLQLHRVSNWGYRFYFLKGAPRTVKYCFDYQGEKNPQNFLLNQENGWRVVFTSYTGLRPHNLWMQEYAGQPPLFYRDEKRQLSRARLFALLYLLLFFVWGAHYVARPFLLILRLCFLLPVKLTCGESSPFPCRSYC